MATIGKSYFDRARAGASASMLAAGAAAVAGTFLEWVTIVPPERVPDDQAKRVATFTGVETSDGWIVLIAAGVILLSAFLIVVRKRSLYGWLGFFSSMLIGGVALADYRGIEKLFYDEMNRIGDPSPAFGLTLVAASALVGIIASVIGVAASPAPEAES